MWRGYLGLHTRGNAEGDCYPENKEVARANCVQGSINSRINVLYFLDSLCETSLMVKSHSKSERSRSVNANGLYVQFVSRDLNRIVESIVPEGKQGLPNLVSAKQVRRTQVALTVLQTLTHTQRSQILENWRTKRYVDPQKIDDVLSILSARPTPAPATAASTPTKSPHQTLPRAEVNKRIEQDRERHKRLRERRWVQPTSHSAAALQPPLLACFYPLGEAVDGQEEYALDIEFENDWETTSDWNEDDEEAIGEEAELAFRDDEAPSGERLRSRKF